MYLGQYSVREGPNAASGCAERATEREKHGNQRTQKVERFWEEVNIVIVCSFDFSVKRKSCVIE